MEEAEKIMQKYVMYKDVKVIVSIYKTDYFYDIIISGDSKVLQKIKDANDIESIIMDKNKIGDIPMMIYDTTDSHKDALQIYDKIKELLK